MKIVSKFKDYYDCIQGIVYDKECLYIRNKNIVEEKLPEKRYWWNYITQQNGIIGFCGKIYPFCDIECIRFRLACIGIDKIIWTKDEYIKIIEENCPDKIKKDIMGYAKYHLKHFWEQDFSKYNDLFFKYKVPIFTLTDKFVLNDDLQQYEFYKQVEPYTAFQEIYMYISGILGNSGRSIPEVSDEDMIAAKGFDKFSFRKDKSK